MGNQSPRPMLAASECIKGRTGAIPRATPQDAKHFIKGTPLHGPFPDNTKTALIGMGCFWCSENLFMRMDGVYSTSVGYAAGETKNPTYEEVCTGRTNHSEVCRIVYDPKVLSYRDILKIFWLKHDPTTLNRQGGDRGTQYRSGIYFYDSEQEKIAKETRDAFQKIIDKEHPGAKISTEILPAPEIYYMAEEYHQQYDAKPGNREYCGLRPLRIRSDL